MVLIILIVPIVIFLVYSRKQERKFAKWAEADRLHSALFNKYLELCDDPCMTEAKWKEWAKVFRYADKYYEANNYLGATNNRLEHFARQWID